MTDRQRSWIWKASLAIAALAVLATAAYGIRSYRTFLLLRSAYELGMPQASTVRAWMTLRYIATTYRVPEDRLRAQLALPPSTSLDLSLRSIAERQGMTPLQYVQQVQRSIADIAPPPPPAKPRTPQGWFDWFNDRILSALLRYGYAMLGLTVLLGAIGLPVPMGIAAVVAGSLAAAGRLDWAAAGLIAVVASVAGDAVAYGLGRGVSEQFLARRGRLLGYTAKRYARARALFDHWGALTVLVTRTLVSHLSSVVSLLAGMSHYRLAIFLPVALAGRVLWTAAYMALGYSIGGNLEAATGFLKNFSLLLLSVSVLLGSALIVAGRLRFGRRAVA